VTEEKIKLPYNFDSARYVRLALYVVVLCPLIALAGNSLTLLNEPFQIAPWLRLIATTAIGLGICAGITHMMLRYMGCAKGVLSAGYVMIEPVRIFSLDGGRKGGNFPLSDFSGLRLIHPRRYVRTSSGHQWRGKNSHAHILQLRAKNGTENDIVISFGYKAPTSQLAEQLAHALNLPLEVKE